MNSILDFNYLNKLNTTLSNSNGVKFIENKKLLQLNLNKNEESFEEIYCIDPQYYINIYNSFIYHLDYSPNTKKRTKSIVSYLTLSNHFHACSPKTRYLGIRYDLIGYDDKIFYRAKFGPYYIDYYNRYEINLGIVLKNSKDIYTFGDYPFYAKHIKDINVTNISPSHIYIHALDNKFFKNGLDKSHINYKNDMMYLNDYANQINSIYNDLDLSFNDEGILFYNKKYKIKELYDNTKKIINYKPISSYILMHHE